MAASDRLTEQLRSGGDGGTVPDEAFFAAAMPADFAFEIDLEKATKVEVVHYALGLVKRVRMYYDKRGRFENIIIIAGKEFSSVGRGQAVANRKCILEILSDHFLVVVYKENYTSQLHYKCGRPLDKSAPVRSVVSSNPARVSSFGFLYRKHEVRTKICYCCTLERTDGRPELVNRDFNASVNMVDWFCYELQYKERPRAACGPNRVIAPIQGDEMLHK
jgi:hypothetical protein